ncbi:PREDICTED: uncharacterized protein LOC108492763 [Lepidothrix coronata]|uniref:Uncharacterized protein LOC108492763 n=1 Tax=Lepidothrix coronata TaxID=321398 RepID=A0A6J0GBB0_9PASS|nr:PREDICTED: uncharacterized protein LOC108492763 [Lepidothrix coronata]
MLPANSTKTRAAISVKGQWIVFFTSVFTNLKHHCYDRLSSNQTSTLVPFKQAGRKQTQGNLKVQLRLEPNLSRSWGGPELALAVLKDRKSNRTFLLTKLVHSRRSCRNQSKLPLMMKCQTILAGTCSVLRSFKLLHSLRFQSYQNQLGWTERHLEVQDVPKEFSQRDMQV